MKRCEDFILMRSDQELIDGCIRSDRKCQRDLYDAYASRLLAVSMRYMKSTLEAEDVLQEAFLKIFDNISEFRNDSSLYYWMKRVVVRTALNANRRKLYLLPMYDLDQIDYDSSKDFTLANIQLEEMLELIQQLPTGCRVIFNLYAIEGFQHKEIAEMLEVSESTSKTQYGRARKLLQEKLANNLKMNYGQHEGSKSI